MRSLLKTVLVCSVFSLLTILCLAEDRPQQGSSSVPTPVKLRVLITDCVDQSSVPDPEVGRDVTGALYIALDGFGKNAFDAITQQEVWAAAERLGLPVPEAIAPSGHWKEDDKIRLGQALNVDLLCNVQVAGMRVRANSYRFVINLTLSDINLQFPRTGGCADVWNKTLSKAVIQGVNDAAQQCPKRLFPAAHVLNRMDHTVTVDFGVREGAIVGEDMVVCREVAGKKIKVGMGKVSRCYLHDSEGAIVSETGSIQAGDAIFICYYPVIGCFPQPSKKRH